MKGKAVMSVTDRMTSAVSKIADACEESARAGVAVDLEWSQEEIPENFSWELSDFINHVLQNQTKYFD